MVVIQYGIVFLGIFGYLFTVWSLIYSKKKDDKYHYYDDEEFL